MEYTLKAWVKDQGGALSAAKKLKVTKQVVHYWLRGCGSPRVTMMLRLIKISNGRLSIYDLINETTRNKRKHSKKC